MTSIFSFKVSRFQKWLLVLCYVTLWTCEVLAGPTGPSSSVLKRVDSTQVPLGASYWTVQHPAQPPLPLNPFPDLPIYYLGVPNTYLIDDSSVDYAALRQEQSHVAALAMMATMTAGEGEGFIASGYPLGDCEATLVIESLTNAVRLTVTNANAGVAFDLFRTLDFFGDSVTNSYWYWVSKATNGQVFTFSNGPCSRGFYVLGCTNDSDADGLTDAFELLVNKTSPLTNYSVNALYTDLQMVNVLVNSPDEDCGNEQNTQFESTCAVLGSNVIVAYVDSNQGVYGLGNQQINSSGFLTNRVPQMIGYAVSTNGGMTFEDRGVPPLSRAGAPTNDDGVAGDPWLAVDTSSNWVYMVGTSPRNAGNYGIPIWRSTNGGFTFGPPTNVMNDILESDKPCVVVDDGPSVGQHDVYVTCTGRTNGTYERGYWFTVSRDGAGGSWTNKPVALRITDGTNVSNLGDPLLLFGQDHVGYAFWIEKLGLTNWLKTAQVLGRGTGIGPIRTIQQLRIQDPFGWNLNLWRRNSSSNETFNAWPIPVPALNKAKTGHLYVTYADRGTNSGDRADIYFTYSTDAGTNWTAPVLVNTVLTNDQWMPVLAVNPDGTKLFIAWYDRRADTNNGLMELYARWGAINTDGIVTLEAEFRITPSSFPPVFSGTDTNNLAPGHYDPTYPPYGANLNWWYAEWPDDPFEFADGTHASHVGEYNGIWADANYVCLSWTDNHVKMAGVYARNQSDIQFIRLPWP